MNKLSNKHKDILNSLANIYSVESMKGTGKYYSKRCLRQILIHYKWDKNEAIHAIETDKCYYWWADD